MTLEQHTPSEQQKQSDVRLTVAVSSGPLPAPMTLQHYDTVLPGLAAQIASQALMEQKHRHMIAITRLVLGFVTVVLLLGVSVFFVLQAAFLPASVLLGTFGLSVCIAIFLGKEPKQKDSHP